jgi:hypothetical protein
MACAKPSALGESDEANALNARYRRKPDISFGGRERRGWADSAPTGAASGATGVRVIAVIADTVQRPFLVFDFTERRGSAFRPAAYRRGRLRNDWRSGRIAGRSG